MTYIETSLTPITSLPVEQGLDERINYYFTPVADTFDHLVFYKVPLGAGKEAPFILLLLLGAAFFFTLYFGFINFRRFSLAIKIVRGKYDYLDKWNGVYKAALNQTEEHDLVDTIKDESIKGEVSHFQALSTAVSGTVGLGNIAGVAIAIALGGPGATFWMIVAGLLGMTSKFVECTLAVKYREIRKDGSVKGGPMYYLKKGYAESGYPGLGKALSLIFALCCVGGSFGAGNAIQSNQATQQIISTFSMEGGGVKTAVGFFIAIFVGLIIIGGIKRIAQITEKVVPFMALLYIASSLVIIFGHYEYIDDAFAQIMSEAFHPRAEVGGFIGAMMVGFQRASFSNEAGAGSAPIAHSAVRTNYPVSEGLVALLEPFIDTVVICTMTALVIIMFNIKGEFIYGGSGGAVVLNSTGKTVSGVDLTTAAYEAVLPHFSYALTIAIVLFAVSTMISWSYYGMQAWKFLFGDGKVADLIYKVLFLSFIVLGAAAKLDAVYRFSDAMILAMVYPNMAGLLLLFPKVKTELRHYLSKIAQDR